MEGFFILFIIAIGVVVMVLNTHQDNGKTTDQRDRSCEQDPESDL